MEASQSEGRERSCCGQKKVVTGSALLMWFVKWESFMCVWWLVQLLSNEALVCFFVEEYYGQIFSFYRDKLTIEAESSFISRLVSYCPRLCHPFCPFVHVPRYLKDML
ncbi:unnamed protein product, partial [Choristocarpus tenellus]